MNELKLPARSPAPEGHRVLRTQLGALCYRIREGRTEVLLVTTRGRGRWGIPKGWPIGGQTPGQTALREAWEEAGVKGRLAGNAVGVYTYVKGIDRSRLPCIVAVFPVRVKRVESNFPERGERRRKWLSPRGAAALVEAPELRQILRQFDPHRLQCKA